MSRAVALLPSSPGPAAATTSAIGFIPSFGQSVLAMLRRDSSERRFAGVPFVLDFVLGIVNLAVFFFISRVLRHPGPTVASPTASYFDFVAVGIAFMLVLQAAGLQITSRINEEKRNGTLEMLAAQPVSSGSIAVGISAYPMAFAVLRAGAYLGIAGGLFGLHVGSADWLAVVTMLALGCAAMMCLGIVLAALTVAFEHAQTVARLLIVALSFGSGTYFPTSALPPILRTVSFVLPTRVALDGLRAALSGGKWGESALALSAATAAGLPLSIRLFRLALRSASRRGTLSRG